MHKHQKELTPSKYLANAACVKNHIQKEGITTATWEMENKLLTVSYNPAVITNDETKKKIAAVGRDTEKYKAEDAVYNKLPG